MNLKGFDMKNYELFNLRWRHKFNITDYTDVMVHLTLDSVWSPTFKEQQVRHKNFRTVSKIKYTEDHWTLIIHATMEQEVQVNVFLLHFKYLAPGLTLAHIYKANIFMLLWSVCPTTMYKIIKIYFPINGRNYDQN